MKNKLIGALVISVLTISLSNAQDKMLAKAHESFTNFDYSKAIKQYEQVLKKGNTSPVIYQNLGDANYLNANYEKAAKWYEQLSNSGSNAMDKEHMYKYAISLRSIKKYDASNKLMAELHASKQADIRGVNYNKNQDYFEKIKARYGSYSIENIAINSSSSDFAPSFRLEGLVFTTGRDTNGISKNVHTWNKKRFLNLYTATNTENGGFKNIMKFSRKLNTKLHESSTAFTADGNTVYFTRNNGNRRKFSRDNSGISRLKIYKSEMKNGKWGKAIPLPFNDDSYSVAHPTLNTAENKLYFSSDMPGTLGHSDIFVVDIMEDGTYGAPKNLGAIINTESKESFPFIAENDILYFASDGHPGLGGMDIYAIDLKKPETSLIVNLGEPLNSIADDFSLIINTATKKGYFASNRADGKGDDDIYAFTEQKPINFECLKNISGVVKDKKSGNNVANATIVLYNNTNEIVDETVSNTEGNFTFTRNCIEDDFLIVASKESYEKDKVNLKNENQADVSDIELLLLQIDKGAPIGTDLTEYLRIAPIYFNLNKSFIREDAKAILTQIIAYMNKYPETHIEVRSHTDSRSSDSYNMQLSQKRAQATIDYLTSQGIVVSRIKGIGFGEKQLTNECKDGTKCNEYKHQQNRRSEFIVVD